MKRLFVAFVLLAGCGAEGGSSGSGGSGSPGGGAPPPPPPPPAGGPVYPGAGTGAHYWIDPAGNDANAGTSTSPWRTLDKLESTALAPGDLVHVRPGLYIPSTNLMLTGKIGSASAWIGIQAEGAVTIRNTAVANVIDISNCRYLFLKGFEITHDNGGAAYSTGSTVNWAPVDGVKFQGLPSDHVSIDACRIHSLGNVGVSSQVSLAEYLWVVNCEIRDCYTGLYWGYYEDVNKRYAHDGWIAGNYIHDCPPVDADGTGYGIQIKGGSRGNVIEDNVIVNCAGSTRAGIAVYHISTDAGTQTDANVIRRNLVRAARNEGIYAVEGAVIENNLVVDCRARGISVGPRNTGSWGTFYGNLTIRHNSVCRVTDAAGRGAYVDGAAFTGSIVVANNLVIVTGGGQQSLRCPSTFTGTSSSNVCYGATSGFPSGVTAAANLSMVQSTTYGAANFLFPAAGGSLTGSAAPATSASDDFNGTTRTGSPDIGAYEALSPANPGWTPMDGFKS